MIVVDSQSTTTTNLQIPKLDDLFDEIQFNSCGRFQLIQTLNSWCESKVLDSDGERRLKCLLILIEINVIQTEGDLIT